jgi:hypothetical protein
LILRFREGLLEEGWRGREQAPAPLLTFFLLDEVSVGERGKKNLIGHREPSI